MWKITGLTICRNSNAQSHVPHTTCHIPNMLRAFASNLRIGTIELDNDESHHLAGVLRVSIGDDVEVFDEDGAVGIGKIERVDRKRVVLNVRRIEPAPAGRSIVEVFSAIPKGERADWMIEKLSETSCARLTLLRTSRSVTAPKGQSKWARWRRIAIESAKQCRRVGVMQINDELVDLNSISAPPAAMSKSTRELGVETQSRTIRLVASLRSSARRLIDIDLLGSRRVEIFIGPEGDFSDEEYDTLVGKGAIEVALTPTVMRVETAAVVACATVSQLLARAKAGE